MSGDASQIKEAKQIPPEVEHYYDTVDGLLKAVGAYLRTSKYRDNMNDPDINWKKGLQDTFQKYYGGSYSKLDASVRARRKECFEYIEQISELCREAKLTPVRKPANLFEMLRRSDKRRAFWRKAIKRHKKQGLIVTLQQIEREYQSSI